ncbi:nucleoside diphosphate kinase [Chytriomyces sp. MP71]|nr:nucleoside diphosphate kinase [Chytriomyces sp. MP71]
MDSWEDTVLLIRPEARHSENHIVHRLNLEGFKILERRHIEITTEQAEAYYISTSGDPENFDAMQDYVRILTMSGSSVVLLLSRFNAFDQIKALMGSKDAKEARDYAPHSLRARFAVNSTLCGVEASEDLKSTEASIKVFFPDRIRTTLPSVDESKILLEDSLYPVLTQGLTMLCKTKPANPTVWLGTWLLENNPNRPKVVESDSS